MWDQPGSEPYPAGWGDADVTHPLDRRIGSRAPRHASISRMDSSLREEYVWIVPEVLREFMVYEKKAGKQQGGFPARQLPN